MTLVAEAPTTAPSPTPSVWPERYDMLDAWRGVAALAVVLSHIVTTDGGFYGVMAFFVISGYCVTAAAEACQRKNLGWRGFMWRRVRRIYPPYLLALVFFLVTRLLRRQVFNVGFHHSPSDWAMNLTLTQWLPLLFHPIPVAAENPSVFMMASWSLCYEEQFYLIMGLMLFMPAMIARRDVIIALLLVGIGWEIFTPRVCRGVFLEYWPNFAIGALVYYRLCRMPNRRLRRATDLILIVSTLALIWLASREGADHGVSRRVFHEMAFGWSFALVLIYLRPLSESFKRAKLARPLMWLGLISYSLYLVHHFNVHLANSIADAVAPAWAGMPIKLAILIGIATGFWYCCERPFLNRPIVPASGAPSVRDEVLAPAAPGAGA